MADLVNERRCFQKDAIALNFSEIIQFISEQLTIHLKAIQISYYLIINKTNVGNCILLSWFVVKLV